MFSGISPAAKSNVAAVRTSVTADPLYECPGHVDADTDGAEARTAAAAVTASAMPTFRFRKRLVPDALRRAVGWCCCCMTLLGKSRVADQWALGDREVRRADGCCCGSACRTFRRERGGVPSWRARAAGGGAAVSWVARSFGFWSGPRRRSF